ncbi:MAG TPA: heat-inducible transcription repressor HrcA [Gammaproteobacteria bacterium]|jgi:heat-inducible transcriptional repressor|nr:heat-inducible transcription repressor HrcA [Gammaproteobacteria bacterium]HIK76924.1 heat-inducible transcription repressor HrcA [Gammaproteobacteria bacterium]
MPEEMKNKTPSDRAKQILSAIIDNYIEEGTPIGSKKLSSYNRFNLSSATIRNVMSDLEDLGFIASPHTSAGRIPTSKGYRFFIDRLLEFQPVDSNEIASIKDTVSKTKSSNKDLATNVSTTLSAITQLAGIVTVPKQHKSTLKEIDFIPLSEQRVLVIVVINDSEVENKILQMKRNFSRDELQISANYLNQNYVGRSFEYIKNNLLTQLKETSALANSLMNDIINIADELLTNQNKDEYVVTGKNQLLDFEELSDINQLKELFDAFNEQQLLLQLLDKSISTSNIQIFIGQESGYRIFDNCTLITAPYTNEVGSVGVLGVIGPTRIAYQRVIPIVDVTAKLLSQSLK